MAKIQKWTGGKILKVAGKIAKNLRCCCGGGVVCAEAGCQCPRGPNPGQVACYQACYLFRVKTGDFKGCDSTCADQVDTCATNEGMYGGGGYLEPAAGSCPCLWTSTGPDGCGTQACVCQAGDCDGTTPVTPDFTTECVEHDGSCVVKATLQWDTATWELVDFNVAGTAWQTFTRVTSLLCNCNTPSEMEVKAATCPTCPP